MERKVDGFGPHIKSVNLNIVGHTYGSQLKNCLSPYAKSDALVRRGISEEEGEEDDGVVNQVWGFLALCSVSVHLGFPISRAGAGKGALEQDH